MQDAVALVALIDSIKAEPRVDREWLTTTLQTHWDFQPAGSSATRAWSVGGVHGLETLVQSRPVVRDRHADFVDDFLRVPSQCTIASYAIGSSQRPVPRLEISRFERWIGIQSEGIGGRTPAKLCRELRERLPGFLARSLRQGTDRELVLFTFLACLHEVSGIGRTYAAALDIRRALRLLDDRLGNPERFHMLVADGRTTGVFHRGGSLLSLVATRAKPQRKSLTGPHPAVDRHPTSLLLIHNPEHDAAVITEGVEAVADGVHTLRAEAPVHLESD